MSELIVGTTKKYDSFTGPLNGISVEKHIEVVKKAKTLGVELVFGSGDYPIGLVYPKGVSLSSMEVYCLEKITRENWFMSKRESWDDINIFIKGQKVEGFETIEYGHISGMVVLSKRNYKSKDGTIKDGVEIEGQFYAPKNDI